MKSQGLLRIFNDFQEFKQTILCFHCVLLAVFPIFLNQSFPKFERTLKCIQFYELSRFVKKENIVNLCKDYILVW